MLKANYKCFIICPQQLSVSLVKVPVAHVHTWCKQDIKCDSYNFVMDYVI